MFQKIKGSTGLDSTTAIYFMVIIGVGVSAFGLGRLSVGDASTKANQGIAIEGTYGSLQIPTETRISTTKASGIKAGSQAGNYVASKNGKLYYTRGCKAANRIKPENEVWFTDASEAESMGYTRSGSCK
jgi:hypothetical protein